MTLASGLALVPALCASTTLGAQIPSVLIRVIDSTSQQPLPNAEIIDRVTGVRRFTNAAGEASMPRGADELALRGRQIGFQFIDLVVAASVDPVTFALARVAYVLPAVHTTTTSACATETDPAAALLSASVLSQLRLGAERYEEFRRAYPFRVQLERRTGDVTSSGDVKPTRARLETEHSDRWGERYVPNRIVERFPLGFSVPILFLTALADSVSGSVIVSLQSAWNRLAMPVSCAWPLRQSPR